MCLSACRLATLMKNSIFSAAINQPCDVIKMRDYPSHFRFFLTSPLIPKFYDVTWLIFETFCKASSFAEFAA